MSVLPHMSQTVFGSLGMLMLCTPGAVVRWPTMASSGLTRSQDTVSMAYNVMHAVLGLLGELLLQVVHAADVDVLLLLMCCCACCIGLLFVRE